MSAAERIEAVVFDMDGVLVDTEHLWDEVREALTEEWGGRYTPEAQEAMMGMSSPEWSRYLHEVVGLREPPEVINAEVVRRMLERYEADLPVVPGAVEAVRRLAAAGYRLAVASSSNRELIDGVLRRLGLSELFAVTVSSEEVARGKPAPDVYLETARRLGVPPGRCMAIEDSASGIRAAHSAGMRVIAYPNRHYPPAAEVLGLADVVVDGLAEVGALFNGR
ncbi:HAD family phosphatase [Gaiella sp.]|uniref:HAD family hydrolase n=1 Tax=Gaiella sp. TaxID=2663207 RepID=UPI002C6E16B7|nr:HAD family phosphatase [Gaiella sp.]HWO81850.1 HAD family phosphatase [Gaiella sp.]